MLLQYQGFEPINLVYGEAVRFVDGRPCRAGVALKRQLDYPFGDPIWEDWLPGNHLPSPNDRAFWEAEEEMS